MPRWAIFLTKCVIPYVFQVTFKAFTSQKPPGAHVGNTLETLGGPLDFPRPPGTQVGNILETLGTPLDVPSVPMLSNRLPTVTKGLPSFPTFKESTAPRPSGAQVGNILNNVCKPLGCSSNVQGLHISKTTRCPCGKAS